MDDFFIRALVAGMGIAAIAGPFGCFIVWRRLAYFGDTLAHSALLGVALALVFQFDMTIAVFSVAAIIALSLIWIGKRIRVGDDALLGMLSHSALAFGLIALTFVPNLRVDVMGLLVGDILSVTSAEIVVIFAGGALLLLALGLLWKPLFAATVNRDLARAEGANLALLDTAFMLLCALLIALAMKLVGVLLITALLIIPAVTAGRVARGPETMAVMAALCGMVAVAAGLFASLHIDTPSGPSIVAASFFLFVLVAAIAPMASRWKAGR